MTNRPPVLVGIPAVTWVYTSAITALLRLRLPQGSQVLYMPTCTTIAEKRNALVSEFLKHDRFAALLMLDSDMTPPPHALERLLNWNLPIVGGLAFTRYPPFYACAGQWLSDGGAESLEKVDLPTPTQVGWIGPSCLLARREALLQIPPPWFNQVPGGEDMFFCRQAKKAGVPLYCDTRLVPGHLTTVGVDLDYIRAWSATPEAQRMNGRCDSDAGMEYFVTPAAGGQSPLARREAT